MPLCAPQDAQPLLSARRVVVLRGGLPGFAWTLSGPQVSVFGQRSAVIAGGVFPGVRVTGGDCYVRDLSVTGGVGMNATGIIADGGATLSTDGVSVTNNAGGGILLDGAKFEMRNTTVVGNGPGEAAGGVPWGGIRVQNMPFGGPAKLERVTVKDNKAPGLTCSGPIQGVGVFATGNSTIDIASTCMVTPCSPAGPTCGAP